MDFIHLIRHPDTPCSQLHHINAKVSVLPTDILEIEYTLDGEISKLCVPADAARRRADNLWQHTCFEAFIAAPRGAGYLEFNFAPSGEWAIYQFDSYREGMRALDAAPPIITTRRAADNLVMSIVVAPRAFPDFKDRAELRLALSAVIEDSNGHLSYWALAHPPGKPDFHHTDSFTLALDQCRRFT